MSTAISIFSLSTFYMSVGTFDVMGLQDLCHRIITSVDIHFLEAAANYSRQRPVAGESVSAKKLLRIQCRRLLGDQSWRSDIYASYKRSGVFGFLMMYRCVQSWLLLDQIYASPTLTVYRSKVTTESIGKQKEIGNKCMSSSPEFSFT